MNAEQAKYETLWSAHQQYRAVAPGELLAQTFVELAKPKAGETVYDFGCGTGRGAALIAAMTGARVVGIDFAESCLDDDVRGQIEFVQRDLERPLDLPIAEHGYCTDVMEHIPTRMVPRVLKHIVTSARYVYFNISTMDDVMGSLIGEPLHLTVRDPFWWHDILSELLSFRVDWSRFNENSVEFYGTAYMTGRDFAERSALNVEHDKAAANIKRNLSLGLQPLVPHEPQPDTLVYVLGGGPSLSDHEEEILEGARRGVPCVTVNGTYNWCLERGIKPAAFVMTDAREFNARFVSKVLDNCAYFVGSQCDHDFVRTLPKDRTWLWHAHGSAVAKAAIQEYSEETGEHVEYYPVAGGTTVMTRAITLLAMLGYRKLEVFGWDSCLRGDRHHAYDQPENDQDSVVPIEIGGRQFACHPWMVVQANEVPRVIQRVWSHVPELELSVRGDGIIATLLEQAAGD